MRQASVPSRASDARIALLGFRGRGPGLCIGGNIVHGRPSRSGAQATERSSSRFTTREALAEVARAGPMSPLTM